MTKTFTHAHPGLLAALHASKGKTSDVGKTEAGAEDEFYGQPHTKDEVFSDREFEPEFLGVFLHEPFLGTISLALDKRPDVKCRTAYVGVNKDNYELKMGYNPYFFRSLTAEERQGVIIHELYHIVAGHLFERNVTDSKYGMAWNISTDLAINSMIGHDRLPDSALIPGRVPSKCKDQKLLNFIKNVQPMQAGEFYFEGVKKIMEENEKENGDGGFGGADTLDDHGGWGDIPQDVQDEIQDKFRGMLERAVNNADSKASWGTVPAEMQANIRKYLKHEVDWREVMKQFFGNARSMTRKSTMKKLSKKAPYMLPGCKRGTVAKFAFFIDQSGSMSDDDVCLCFAEVEGASKETNIDVYNFDTEIDVKSHRVWKRGAGFQWGRTRCGGTDFDAVQRFVNSPENRGRWSGVVILTDGYAPTMGAVVGAKILWIVTPGGTREHIREGDLLVQLQKPEKKATKA